jgi:hypothetical protein
MTKTEHGIAHWNNGVSELGIWLSAWLRALMFNDLGESFSFPALDGDELPPTEFDAALSIGLVSGVGFSVVGIPSGECTRGLSSAWPSGGNLKNEGIDGSESFTPTPFLNTMLSQTHARCKSPSPVITSGVPLPISA